MEQLLKQFNTLKKAEPSPDLEERIWAAVLSQKEQIISPYKVALAACCIGIVFLLEINLAKSGRADKRTETNNQFGLTSNYDLYHD